MSQGQSKDDLIYPVPPDIYHYENVIFLGFTDKEILLIVGVAVVFSMLFGLAGFILGAVIALLFVKRLDVLSNRSIISYWTGKIITESRNTVIEIPKLMPNTKGSIEFMTWDFKPVMDIQAYSDDVSIHAPRGGSDGNIWVLPIIQAPYLAACLPLPRFSCLFLPFLTVIFGC
mgnify:CR=1 FL=1